MSLGAKMMGGLVAAVALTVAMLVGLFDVVPSVGDDGGKGFDFDDLGGVAEAVTAVVTTITVIVILAEVIGARRDASTERTRGFQERYHGREFRSAGSLALSYLKAADTLDCVGKIEAWHSRTHAEDKCLPRTPNRGSDAPKPAVNDVLQVLSFFEDLGTAYNRKDLTRGVIHDSFARSPAGGFVTAWWYVCWRREGRLMDEEGEKLWGEWEKMVMTMRKKKVVSGEDPASPTRILCLPENEEGAGPDDWDGSRVLSVALNPHADRLGAAHAELERRLPAIGERPATRGAHGWAILRVSRVGARPDRAWKRDGEAADRLAEWLGRASEPGELAAVVGILNDLASGVPSDEVRTTA